MTRALDRLAHPTRGAVAITAGFIFVGAFVFLYSVAVTQGRDFKLRYQDEYSYRIQTLMAPTGVVGAGGIRWRNFRIVSALSPRRSTRRSISRLGDALCAGRLAASVALGHSAAGVGGRDGDGVCRLYRTH